MSLRANPELSLSDLVDSVNDAATTARTLSAAMLGTAVTLAATILASTDEALLRDSLDAPFSISFSIKLSVAYALMPLVFLYLHGNILLQLHVLLERLSLFEELLKRDIVTQSDRDRWRRRLTGFAVVQYFTDDEFGGSRNNRTLEYFRNLLLWTVIRTAAVIVPLALLFATLVSFLRYQSETITFIHQAAVVIDLVFIVWFAASQEIKVADRHLNHPSELPVTGIILCLFMIPILWIYGADWSTMIAALSGIAVAWLVHRLAKSDESLWVLILLSSLVGMAFCWISSASLENSLWYFILFAIVILFLSARDVAPDRLAEKLVGRFKRVLSAGRVIVKLVVAPASLLLLVTSQAVIPNGDEPACQIRWDSRNEQEILARPVGRKISEQRSTLFWEHRLLPMLGEGQMECLTPASLSPIANSHPTGEGQAAGIKRANLFDRWTCPQWGIGCRYLLLPSKFLLASGNTSDVLQKTSDKSENYPPGLLASFGINARERTLRFFRAEKSYLVGVDLRGSDLRAAELSNSHMQGALISGADLRDSNMSGAILWRADLYQSDLSGAVLSDTDLTKATLTSSDLQGARLNRVDLSEANLVGANLQGASLVGVNIARTNLKNANLAGSLFLGHVPSPNIVQNFGTSCPISQASKNCVSASNLIDASIVKFPPMLTEFTRITPPLSLGHVFCSVQGSSQGIGKSTPTMMGCKSFHKLVVRKLAIDTLDQICGGKSAVRGFLNNILHPPTDPQSVNATAFGKIAAGLLESRLLELDRRSLRATKLKHCNREVLLQLASAI